VATATVFSQSRGGQLVFLTVLGCYFLKRFGARGLVAGAVVAAPMLILGGRGGAEADSSSKERLECWYEGISMFKSAPVLGVGFRQFTEHHYLTAHNSYVLAPAELGFPGFVLWTAVMYTTTKIPAVALIRYRDGGDAEVARVWAMALLASILGLLVGIFFLSFCYHYVLWIYVGLSGAFYSAVRTHDREFEVRFGLRDLAAVVVIDVALIAALYVYTRVRAPS
jgi:O-antigen ligase